MKYIILHHEAGNNGFESVNEYHRKKWNFRSKLGYYIGYHYYINKKGKLIQGRSEDEAGAHTKGYNNNLGVCLQGNFEQEQPKQKQLSTLKNFLDSRTAKYGLSAKDVIPHKQVGQTLCPGHYLNKWLEDYKKLEQPTLPSLEERIKLLQKKIKALLEAIKKVGKIVFHK